MQQTLSFTGHSPVTGWLESSKESSDFSHLAQYFLAENPRAFSHREPNCIPEAYQATDYPDTNLPIYH